MNTYKLTLHLVVALFLLTSFLITPSLRAQDDLADPKVKKADEQTSPPAVDLAKPMPTGLLIESGIGAFEPQAKPTDLTKPVQISLQPATPVAKLLVEQLAAQESAAAAEAATIRQLQSNGQAEQNKQPIAEHQRKLKNLLSTAFDLKLQSEELQVKELQTRLSRLERQIGQRKELREKIITRHATELIEGDSLKWDAASSATTKVPGLGLKDSAPGAMSSSSTRAAVTKADHIEIDLYAGSQVLPGLGKNPGYSKLIQSLNALKGVTVNVLEAGQGDVIVMAIVRDPSQRCQREARQTQKESELRSAINSALKAAGIGATRWDENVAAENVAGHSTGIAVTQTGSSKPDPKAEMLAKLQGRWELQARSLGPNDASDVDRGFVEIKNNLLTVWNESANKQQNASIILLNLGEPGPPQLIDLIASPNDEDRLVMPGLIEVADDVVRICFDPTSVDARRPGVIAVGKNADIWELRRKPKSDDPKPDPLPTPEELKAKLMPFAESVTVAMQRVRDLEPTFFKDRSNLKEMQQALQQLAQARAAWKPLRKEVEAVFEELNTEYGLAEIIAKGLETRAAALMDKLGRGEATEAEVRAAITAHRTSPRTQASLEARIEKYQTALSDFGDLAIREDDKLPPISFKRTGPQPSYHPAFARAWLETALQTKVDFVSLVGLDLPFNGAVLIKESHNNLKAGDLIVTFNGESFETLDQAVTSSSGAKKPSSYDAPGCLVLKGGLSGMRVAEYLDSPIPDWLHPTEPTTGRYRFDVKVRRGEVIETERITGTNVGPDGLVVIPMAASRLVPDAPIVTFGVDWPVQIVGTDEAHGLMLLKLSGPLNQWTKCRTTLPKLNEKMRHIEGATRSDCVVNAIGHAYPEPLKGKDAFLIELSDNRESIHPGDIVVTADGELQGLVLGVPGEPGAKTNSYHSAIVVPAVHIQKLIDDYRDKSLNQKSDGSSPSQPPKVDAPH